MQVLSAFMIFVIGYLALLFSIVACFSITSFIFDAAAWARVYMMRTDLNDDPVDPVFGVGGSATSRLGDGLGKFATSSDRLRHPPVRAVLAEAVQNRSGRVPR